MRGGLAWVGLLAWLLGSACSDDPDSRADDAGSAPAAGGTSASPSEGSAGRAGSAPPNSDAGRSGTGTQEPPRAGSGDDGGGGSGTGGSGTGGSAADDAATAPDADASTTDAGGDAGEPPSESPTAVYSAVRYIGGLDHVRIIKSDPALGYCVTFHMSFPGAAAPQPELELPESWTSMGAVAIEIEGAACETGSPDTQVVKSSLTERGRVDWRDLGPQGQPCSLDVDVELTFEPTQRIPARERLFAEDLAIACE
jgi:hypothetical protein